jgi:methylenetetrahydrofolate reductase (NADPH)
MSRHDPDRCPTQRDHGWAVLVNVSGGSLRAGPRRPGSQRWAGDAWRRSPRLAELLRNVSYEVLSFKSTEEAVLAHVPTSIPLTVTVTEARGLEPTLRVTERLLGHGYRAAPHLAARLFVDRAQLADVIARLREAQARSVFVIGGDAAKPAGAFINAFSLLRAMHEIGHPFEEIGIAGYPEGHASIPREATDAALQEKQPLATHIITQMCFDAMTTSSWAAHVAALGVGLPIRVGLPGPVSRRKLVRITAGIGLGQSARFLRKQQGLWRFLVPGGYRPTRLARQLGIAADRTSNHIRGLHVFSFNELAGTEAWRQQLLAMLEQG